MKKFITIISIIAILSQVFPIPNAQAAPVYDDIYNSGDIYLAVNVSYTNTTIAFNDTNPDTITDTTNRFILEGFKVGNTVAVTGSTSNNASFTIASVTAGTITLSASDSLVPETAGNSVTLKMNPDHFKRYDSTNSYSEVDYTSGGENEIVFDAYGNQYGANGLALICKTKASNYTSYCSGFPYLWPSGVAIYDPTTGTQSGTITPAGYIQTLAIDGYGNIFAAHWQLGNGSGDGYYITKTSSSTGTLTTVAYDVDYGEATNMGPYSIAIDYLENVWFVRRSDLTVNDHYAYCLDAKNSYQVCSGASFGIYGEIDITYSDTSDIAIDKNNDIFVTSYSSHRVSKIDRNDFLGNTFTVTNSANLSTSIYQPFALIVDYNDRVWLSGYGNSSVNSYTLLCVNADDLTLTRTGSPPCGSTGVKKTVSMIYNNVIPTRPIITQNGSCSNASYTNKYSCELNSATWTDKGNIWLVSTADSALYCYDSSNSFNACATASVVSSGLDVNLANFGDPTGRLIYDLLNTVAGQNQATITAVVDPTISMNVYDFGTTTPTTSCNLGTLNQDGTVARCGVTVNVKTNATSGYNLKIDNINDGGLEGMERAGSSDIIPFVYQGNAAVTHNDVGVALSARTSGWAFHLGGGVLATFTTACSGGSGNDRQSCILSGGTWTVQGGTDSLSNITDSNVSNIGAVSASALDIGGGALPLSWVSVNGFDNDFVFMAKIDNTTPAGSYTHKARFTVTGNF